METILNILGAKDPFDDNGELTSDGVDAYEKLILILHELHIIGAVNKTVDEFEKYFNEVIQLGF